MYLTISLDRLAYAMRSLIRPILSPSLIILIFFTTIGTFHSRASDLPVSRSLSISISSTDMRYPESKAYGTLYPSSTDGGIPTLRILENDVIQEGCCTNQTVSRLETLQLRTSDQDISISYEILSGTEGSSLSGQDNGTFTAGKPGIVTIRASYTILSSGTSYTSDFTITILQTEPTVSPSMYSLPFSDLPHSLPLSINYDSTIEYNINVRWEFDETSQSLTKVGPVGTTGVLRLRGPETDNYLALEKSVSIKPYHPQLEIFGIGGSDQNSSVFKIDSIGTVTILKEFTTNGAATNGMIVSGGLIDVNNWLYGVTRSGGTSDAGVVFRISKTGDQFEVIHHFDGLNGGSTPYGGLALLDGNLWGTTTEGGSNGNGIIYSIDTSTHQFSTLHNFTSSTGITPQTSLLVFHDSLWGTTNAGGALGTGVIFSFDPTTTTYTATYHFGGNQFGHYATLSEHNGLLWGINESGSTSDAGSIFKFDPNTNSYEVIHEFASASIENTTDFGVPVGSPIWYDGKLYGAITDITITNSTNQILSAFYSINDDGSGFEIIRVAFSEDGTRIANSLTLAGGRLWTASEFSGPIQFLGPGNILAFNPKNTQDTYSFSHQIYLESQGTSIFHRTTGPLLVSAKPTSTITFADDTITYGDSLLLEAETVPSSPTQFQIWGESGNEIVEIEGNLVLIAKEVGTINIIASTNGNEDFLGGSATATFEITPKTLEVLANNQSREEGEVNPELTLTYDGFVFEDDESSLISLPTATTEADSNSAPGTYPITVSGGEASNYTFSYTDGTLTVTEKAVTGLSLEDVKGISVYPLPFNDQITVSWEQVSQGQPSEISIIDVLGNTIHTSTISHGGQSQAIFSLNALPTGIYTLVLSFGTEIISVKITKTP